MERYLVTGGAGFIGRHVAAALLAEGARVTILDDFSTGYRENVPIGADVAEGDIRDPGAVDRAVSGVAVVFHLAAYVSAPKSLLEASRCIETNVLGLVNVLEAARRHRVEKVIFSSSSAVYAGEPSFPKREAEAPRPTTPYALTKLDGEHLLDMFAENHGLRWVALRYFNVFGCGQRADSDYAAVIPAFLDAALEGRDLIIYGDGTQTRDFVYVDDVVRANLCGRQRGSGVYNVGTGTAISILELANVTRRLVGGRNEICFKAERPGDVKHSTADTGKITRELDWRPRWRLEEGLAQTLKWWMRSPRR